MRRLLHDRSAAATREFAIGVGAMALVAVLAANLMATVVPPVDPETTGSIPRKSAPSGTAAPAPGAAGGLVERLRGWLPIVR